MKKIILFALVAVTLASCAPSITIGEQYPGMYEEKPTSIAIMPPINKTTHAEAKDFFYTTLYMPLCEKGYYVYSPYLTMELFQQESAYDAELFLEKDLSAFKTVLGADAAMFTIIKDWSRNNVGGTLKVDIEYILRSTKTGKTLYQREGVITIDTSVKGGSGWGGALIGLLATAANTAATDKVVAARKCNVFVLSDMPAGKFSPIWGKDTDYPAGNKVVKEVVR